MDDEIIEETNKEEIIKAALSQNIHIPPWASKCRNLYKIAYYVVKNNEKLSKLPSTARRNYIIGIINTNIHKAKTNAARKDKEVDGDGK